MAANNARAAARPTRSTSFSETPVTARDGRDERERERGPSVEAWALCTSKSSGLARERRSRTLGHVEHDLESELVELARAAAANAHAPYSRFRVGAAVRCVDGRRFSGCNVENASYGLTVCAERNAVQQAVAAGAARDEAGRPRRQVFTELVLWASQDRPTPPCGACRQVLLEFCERPEDLEIVMVGQDGATERTTLADLTPRPFRARDFTRG